MEITLNFRGRAESRTACYDAIQAFIEAAGENDVALVRPKRRDTRQPAVAVQLSNGEHLELAFSASTYEAEPIELPFAAPDPGEISLSTYQADVLARDEAHSVLRAATQFLRAASIEQVTSTNTNRRQRLLLPRPAMTPSRSIDRATVKPLHAVVPAEVDSWVLLDASVEDGALDLIFDDRVYQAISVTQWNHFIDCVAGDNRIDNYTVQFEAPAQLQLQFHELSALEAEGFRVLAIEALREAVERTQQILQMDLLDNGQHKWFKIESSFRANTVELELTKFTANRLSAWTFYEGLTTALNDAYLDAFVDVDERHPDRLMISPSPQYNGIEEAALHDLVREAIVPLITPDVSRRTALGRDEKGIA